MKRMLINATQAEELRVALVDGQNLYDLDIETPHQKKKKGNIYKGVVTRIEPSLEAAFVDYGSVRHGFLPFKELADELCPADVDLRDACIQDILKEGQELIIQVQKEERGNKGAALTTQITLAGSYVVMMPNNPSSGGISRRIEGEDRSELREALSQVEVPEGMGMIVRTAGIGKSPEELQWGINYLAQLWTAILQAAETKPAPFLIYEESDIVTLSIRDYLRQDIGEILIDDMDTFHRARDFIQQVMPQYANKVKPYQDKIPLFSRFQVEAQIESAYQREVVLPSGGVLVIDITEALTAIDINSSRSTRGGDIEETAFHTNMEAACEIAKQLRLRDLGGLVVIDFIDMHSSRNQREVENKLREAVKADRARVQIGKISRFGLLEMSRQRLRPSIEESNHQVCPRCKGVGVIRSVESLALTTLREIEDEAMKEATQQIVAQLPVEVATFLLNEKREQIHALQNNYEANITIVPNETLETPHYVIDRIRSGQDQAEQTSYTSKVDYTDNFAVEATPPIQKEEPAIKGIKPATPAPVVVEKKPGLLARILAWLTGGEEKKPAKNKNRRDNRNPRNNNNRRNNNNQRRRNNNNRRRPDNQEQNTNAQENTRRERQDNRQERQDNRQPRQRQDRQERQDNRQERQDRRAERNEAQNERPQGRRRHNNQRNQNQEQNQSQQEAQARNQQNQQEEAKQKQPSPTPAPAETKAEKAPQQTQTQQKPAAPAPAEQKQQQAVEAKAQDKSEAAATTDAAATSEEKPRRRRSSRYNSRSSINRRRAPRDADKLSVKEL